MMTKNIKKVLSFLVMGAVAVGITSAATKNEVYAAEAKGKITVNGMGEVSAKPDVAYVSVGVTTEGKDPKMAQEENNAQMTKVITAIKKMGIAEKDIKTSNYSIYPVRDYQNGNKLIGYTINNNISITVRNLDKVGEVLSTAVAEGANVGDGIQFSILDSSVYYEQALALAIKNANTKAASIGKAIQKKVSDVTEITETGSNYAPVSRSAEMFMKDSAVPVQAGELLITANITAVYEY